MIVKTEKFDEILKNNLPLISVDKYKLKGSYEKLEYGDLITDIDFDQQIQYNDEFIFNLQRILKKLENTPFKFLEMHCGVIVPYIWKFPNKGDCQFNNNEVDIKNWLDRLYYFAKVPGELLSDIFNRLVNRNINPSVLFDIESELESYNSITWSIIEINNGMKQLSDIKGNIFNISLLEKLKQGQCVIRYLYEYDKDFVIVDSAFIDKNYDTQDYFLKKFYTNDYYGILKDVGTKLDEPYVKKYKDFMKILRTYSYFIYQIEIYTNVNSLKYLTRNNFGEILSRINNFKKEFGIDIKMNLPNLKEYLKMIRENMSSIYVKEYEENIKEEEKDEYNMMKLRTQETINLISKKEIKLREELGITCPFNYSNEVDYVDIYNFAKNIMLDPILFSESIFKTAISLKIPIREVLNKLNMDYSIRSVDYRFGLYKGEELLGKYLYSDIKKLQYIILNK